MSINCLILGYGYMGRIRARVLRAHRQVGQLWVVEPNPANLPDAESRPPSVTFLGAREAIPWPQVDAVVVCTPNNVTADLCIDALRQGKHVFCEKPPGRHWDDFCRIADAAASAPQQVLVFGFNHRLHPSIQSANALIGQGGLGELLYLKGTYGKSGGRRYRESWRNNRDVAGGGILLDQGIHMLDLLQLFAGPLSVVEAVLADGFWNCGVEDNAFVLMRSERGIPAFLHSSATLWKHTFRLELGCRDGYLVASGLLSQTGSYGREQLVVGKRQFEDEALALGNPREEIIHFDRDDSWDREIAEFLTAIAEGRPATHGTLDEARRVMQIIRDAYATAERVSIGRAPS